MNIKNIALFLSGFVITLVGRNIDSMFVLFLGVIVTFSPLFINLFFRESKIKVNEERTKDKVYNTITQLNYKYDKLLMANDLKSVIGFNKENKSILLLNRNKLEEDFNHKMVNFEDIIEVKIKRNSETLTTTSRGSQLASATVGGLAFGGIGMLIGGLSGSSKSSTLTKKLSLEIVINDFDYPVFEIVFINMSNGLNESDELFKILTKDLDHWYRVFTVIIHQNNLNMASS